MPKVQEIQDEGCTRAGSTDAREARGVEQGPRKVNIELRGGGWIDAVARVNNTWVSRSGRFAPGAGSLRGALGDIRFTLVEIDALLLHHAPTVLVLQGMLLQDLFMPDMHFIDQETKAVLVRGPWVFLKGTLSERWQIPLRINDVVLAALEHVPEGLTREQVLAELLAAVL